MLTTQKQGYGIIPLKCVYPLVSALPQVSTHPLDHPPFQINAPLLSVTFSSCGDTQRGIQQSAYH